MENMENTNALFPKENAVSLQKIENITSDGEIVESELMGKPTLMKKSEWEQMSAQLDLLDTAEETVNIKPTYFSFKQKGDSIRGFFQGFTEIQVKKKTAPNELEDLKCVQLYTKQGLMLFAQTSIVSQLEDRQAGEAFVIIYQGTIKTNNGNNMQQFEIKALAI